MTDVAALGLRVDSREMRQGADSLRDLSREAGRAERAADHLGDEFQRTGRRIERSANQGASAMHTLGAASRAVRTHLLALGGAMASAFGAGAAINAVATFGDRMGAVAAVSGATGQQLKALRDVAKDMGATTEFSASQAAEGLQFLAMAGLSADQAVAALPKTLDLATAANLGLGRSADIVSNIMTAFGIAASEVGSAADILAGTAARSNTNVNQIGEAMKFVGTVASNFNVSLSDAAAAVGTLGDAGIQASMAGTGLRRILSSLANPTGSAEKALNALGLTVEDVNPRTNRLTEIVDTLAEAGLGAADALEIFGDRGGPAILALVENRDNLSELTDTLQDVNGEASRMAEIMRDDLSGDLLEVASAAEAVAIEIGDAGATGVMRSFAQAAAAALRAIANNINTIIAAAQTAAIALTAAFGPAMVVAVRNLSVALATNLVGALRAVALAHPFTAIAAAITTVIGAVWSFRDQISLAIGVDLISVAERSANSFIGLFVGAYEGILATWRQFPSAIGDLIIQGMQNVLDVIVGAIREAMASINGLIASINGEMQGLLKLPMLPPPRTFGRITIFNPFEGDASRTGDAFAGAFEGAQRDYIGKTTRDIRKFEERLESLSAASQNGVDVFRRVEDATRLAVMQLQQLPEGMRGAAGREIMEARSAALYGSAGANVLEDARKLLGLREDEDTSVLQELFAEAGHNVDPRMVAWCAAFVNAVLATNNLPGTGSLSARSFLDYGVPTDDPRLGDIAVFDRPSGGPNAGHVGFFQGYGEDGGIRIIGGNQGGAAMGGGGVTETVIDRDRLLGFRKVPGGARGELGGPTVGGAAGAEAIRETTAALQEQNEVMKLSEAIRQRNATALEQYVQGLKEASQALQLGEEQGGISLEIYRREVDRLGEAYKKAAEEANALPPHIKEAQQASQQAAQSIGNMLVGTLFQLAENSENAEESLKRLGLQIAQMVVTGALFGSGPLGDVLGGGLIGGFSASANGNIVGPGGPVPLQKYARGGVANSPHLAMFGEGSTPEAFVPLPDGRTIPVTVKAPSMDTGGNRGGGGMVVNVIDQRQGGAPVQQERRRGANGQEELRLTIRDVMVEEYISDREQGGPMTAADQRLFGHQRRLP